MSLDRLIRRAQNLIDRYQSKEALPTIVRVDDVDEVDKEFNGLVLICNHKKFNKKIDV